jgi:hypothetical protein
MKGIGSLGAGTLSQSMLAMRTIFEQSGVKLAEALSLYADPAIQNLKVMSSETAQALDDAADSFEELKRVLIVDFAPAIAEATQGIKNLYGAAREIATDPEKRKRAIFTGLYGKTWQDALVESYLKDYESRIAAAGGRSQMGGPSAPATNEVTPKAAKTTKSPRTRHYSDSLTSIGNFLGASRDAVRQVEYQREHLQVAKKTLKAQEDENARFDQFMSMMQGIFGGS